jgi:aminoglycoside phosphotransferase (APT) family kinase protein
VTEPLDNGVPLLVPVLINHRFDEAALKRYLAERLPDFDGDLAVRQFQGGQSNPTYHLRSGKQAYVLRKKPSGKLLPGAHAVEREFQIQQALAGQGIPLATMRLLCTDENVIGQAFYIMDHVEGRIFSDRLLQAVPRAERWQMYDSMNANLAALHDIDYHAAGLAEFGKADNYIARQVSRWSRNYQASATAPSAAMDGLISWLIENVPADEQATIVHGDYRLGNLVFHPSRPEVIAILDWEMATIGHPLADLAYNCLPWRLSAATGRGFSDIDFAAFGIPGEAEYVARYGQNRGRGPIADLDYFMVFSMFRFAAILAGIYRRALSGNASDARALQADAIFQAVAEQAWSLCRSMSGRSN